MYNVMPSTQWGKSLVDALGELPSFFVGSRFLCTPRGLLLRACLVPGPNPGLVSHRFLLRCYPFSRVAMALKRGCGRLGRALLPRGPGLHGPGGRATSAHTASAPPTPHGEVLVGDFRMHWGPLPSAVRAGPR